MYDDNGNFGVKCPNGVKISKVLPAIVYIGSQNCLKCYYFERFESNGIYCQYQKKMIKNDKK
jgi:hypothetical protein